MEKKKLAGCAILQGNHILLLHRISKDEYELPGGKIDSGETPEETAVRELKEELLCDVNIIRRLGSKDFEQNGFVMTYYWFLARIQDGQKPELGELEKFSHYQYIPLDELGQYKLSFNMQNLLRMIQEKKITFD